MSHPARLLTARSVSFVLVVLGVLSVLVGAAVGRADPAPAAEPPAEVLLASADRARGGVKDGITWSVEVVAHEEERSERTFLVRARGNDAHVLSLSPPRTKGEVMLFNDRTIWFVKPGLRKPVSISARQRLQGLAANGDLASTNYARDYKGVVVGVDTIDGAKAWRLELEARGDNVTYDRIRYWVAQERRLGVKAEFLTRDGKVFKTARFAYVNRVTIDGVGFDFISKMTIQDAASEDWTEISYGAPRFEAHAASIFNVNNVVR